MVVKRTLGKLYGHNDTVLHSSDVRVVGSVALQSAVRCLRLEPPYLAFIWHRTVVLYDDGAQASVALLQVPGRHADDERHVPAAAAALQSVIDVTPSASMRVLRIGCPDERVCDRVFSHRGTDPSDLCMGAGFVFLRAPRRWVFSASVIDAHPKCL